MYVVIQIRYNIHLQCHVNYIEVKIIQLYAWNWHFKKFLWKKLGCPDGWFLRFGCPKGHPDALPAKTMILGQPRWSSGASWTCPYRVPDALLAKSMQYSERTVTGPIRTHLCLHTTRDSPTPCSDCRHGNNNQYTTMCVQVNTLQECYIFTGHGTHSSASKFTVYKNVFFLPKMSMYWCIHYRPDVK